MLYAHALLVFACGAIYEACCVGFVHHAEAKQPARTALYSIDRRRCRSDGDS
jgi:hypothetical protein